MKKHMILSVSLALFSAGVWSNEEISPPLTEEEMKKICIEEADLEELKGLNRAQYISSCLDDFEMPNDLYEH